MADDTEDIETWLGLEKAELLRKKKEIEARLQCIAEVEQRLAGVRQEAGDKAAGSDSVRH